MSATDELRRMLDERGVEYDVKDLSNIKFFHDTRWNANGVRWCYTEFVGATTCLTMCNEWKDCTPEQAIAATLGSESVDYMLNTIGRLEEENERLQSSCGTLTAEQVREAIEANSWAETSTIREFNDSSWQAIADELNAKLGSEREVELVRAMEDVLRHSTDTVWAGEAETLVDRMVSLGVYKHDVYEGARPWEADE